MDGTIYYEAEDGSTIYVAGNNEAEGENAQYQYQVESGDGEMQQQEWEQTNEESAEGQEGEKQQEQIFLHEDEDGQLYFKDDAGILQPVYLTADGNYAIAENGEEEGEYQPQDCNNSEQQELDEDSYIVPEVGEISSSGSSNKQDMDAVASITDMDNEDSTVTISLIISEDENGQKRTQVIIPSSQAPKCDICNKTFKTSFQLLKHNRLKHAREEDITTRSFPCDMCPKRYLLEFTFF